MVVAGCLALFWAALIVWDGLNGRPGTFSARASGVVVWSVYGAALIARDRRAVWITWFLLLLLSVVAVRHGFRPVHVVAWAGFLWFALYLRRHRAALLS